MVRKLVFGALFTALLVLALLGFVLRIGPQSRSRLITQGARRSAGFLDFNQRRVR